MSETSSPGPGPASELQTSPPPARMMGGPGRIVTLAARCLVWGPIILSILIRPATSTCDYLVQGGLLFAFIAVPASAPPDTGFWWIFSRLYGLSLVWGIWRMVYADGVMNNDVPAIGYLIVGIPWILLLSGSTWAIRAIWNAAKS